MINIDQSDITNHLFSPEPQKSRFSVGFDRKDIELRLEPLISESPDDKEIIVQAGIDYLKALNWDEHTNTRYGTVYVPSGISIETVKRVSYR